MTHTSPIPAEPSVESVRMLRRREKMKRLGYSAGKLRMMRAMLGTIDRIGRLPKTVNGLKETYGEHGLQVLWILPPGGAASGGVVLHLYGGGFVQPPVHRAVLAAYAVDAGMPVVLPRYRLAPEHPFPAAADDALAAYRHLLNAGFEARDIRLSGDSSGGFLATALLGDIARAGLPMPGAVLLLSPLVDLTAASAHHRDTVHRDPSTSPDFVEATSKAYAGDTPLTDPRLDVLGADKNRWPPMLIQTGDTELLMEENERLAESVHAAGGECELQLWPGQIHVFPFVGGKKLPEAKAAREYGA